MRGMVINYQSNNILSGCGQYINSIIHFFLFCGKFFCDVCLFSLNILFLFLSKSFCSCIFYSSACLNESYIYADYFGIGRTAPPSRVIQITLWKLHDLYFFGMEYHEFCLTEKFTVAAVQEKYMKDLFRVRLIHKLFLVSFPLPRVCAFAKASTSACL
ncbi:hypothetical protein I3843_14G046600 [Carya illinoinensis]|nr:hypothetical protein I3843_14G046600 [Carya illinoinensis]